MEVGFSRACEMGKAKQHVGRGVGVGTGGGQGGLALWGGTVG